MVQGFYRNHMEEVIKFFETHHKVKHGLVFEVGNFRPCAMAGYLVIVSRKKVNCW